MQQARRHNPYPLTWEIPLAVACTVLLSLVLGVHLGRGLANLTAGAGWTWPDQARLFRSVPAVLTGHATAGIPTTNIPAGSRTATPANLTGWLAVTELAVTTVLVAAGVFVARRWGPHRLKGMATPTETERLLGVSRLRRVRHLVRPDLQTTRTPDRTGGSR